MYWTFLVSILTFVVAASASSVFPASTPSQAAWHIVGEGGGWTRVVAVKGQYVYAGVGARLMVVDISDPAGAREAGSSSCLPDAIEDIALSGQYAYVAAGTAGLHVLDISDPVRPIAVGSWDSPGFARGVAVSGSFAYLADGPLGLRVIDVSNAATPREAASAFLLQNVYKVRVAGPHAYIAAAGAGLLIADVSRPDLPRELATQRIEGYAYDLAVKEDLVYVAAGWGGLQVVDVKNPSRPVPAAKLKLSGWAFGVAVTAEHAFIAVSLKGLRAIDISDPRRPAEVGSLEWHSALAFSVAVTGDIAFVADGQSGVHAIDVSDPRQLSRMGFYGAMAHASNLAISGDLAYVAAGYSGFRVFDLSDRTKPRELGAYGDGQSYFSHLWVDGSIVFATSILGESWGLHVLDVSDPSRPRRVTHYTPSVNQVHDIVVVGDIAYLSGEQQLLVLEVSDPSHPVEKYILPLSDQYGTFDAPLTISGTRAYLGLNGLQIIDLSDPLRPVRVGGYQGRDNVVRGLAVQGNKLYLSYGNGTLLALDVSDPANPNELATFGGSGAPVGLALENNDLYVAAGNSGVDVYNVADPRSPKLTSSTKTLDRAHGIILEKGTVYVADQRAGLTVLQQGPTPPPAQSFWRGLAPLSTAPAIVSRVPRGARSEVLCLVTSTADAGPGTLRTCLENARFGDKITFDPSVFPPERPSTISVQSALPALHAGAVTIDGSDAGVVLDGSQARPGTNGIHIESEENVVRGLQVVRFPGEGIAVWASRNTIGGERGVGAGPLGQGNLVSGNGRNGIMLNLGPTDCVVEGNLIGTTLDGRSSWPNATGLMIDVGTNTLVKDNVISGNAGSGVAMTDWGTGFNSFVGNLIGTDATGLAALGNNDGLNLAYLGFNRVGGTDPNERNVISGNSTVGIWVAQGVGNLVLGNLIGVDAHGKELLENPDGGVRIRDGARETVIGGSTSRERNVFGMRTGGGAAIRVETDFNVIAGNVIGTDDCASAALGGSRGIIIDGASHTIVQRNRITNGGIGVEVTHGVFNTIRRNAIWQNEGPGIEIQSGNEAIAAPRITTASAFSISGQACAGCNVEVYSDEESEGRNFEGVAVAGPSGIFKLDAYRRFLGPHLTATSTDATGNTSAFSEATLLAPAAIPERRRPVRPPCIGESTP